MKNKKTQMRRLSDLADHPVPRSQTGRELYRWSIDSYDHVLGATCLHAAAKPTYTMDNQETANYNGTTLEPTAYRY